MNPDATPNEEIGMMTVHQRAFRHVHRGRLRKKPVPIGQLFPLTFDSELPASEIDEETDNEAFLEDPTSTIIKEGSFILVSFHGVKRGVKLFRYVCIVQDVLQNSELSVMGLISTDKSKKIYKPKENDISVISRSDVVAN